MFHDGQAVLGLLLFQIENLPQLLQLLQLTEGLQHHQHGNQTKEEIHCGTQREERDGEMMECKLFTVFMLTFELKGVYQTFLCLLYISVCFLLHCSLERSFIQSSKMLQMDTATSDINNSLSKGNKLLKYFKKTKQKKTTPLPFTWLKYGI